MDYPGKVIRKTPVTPTQTSASGVWTVDDALQAVKTNTWPIAGVPNPISRSLRFNSADSAYLNRTPASAGNRKTWTWSGWVKRSTFSTLQSLETVQDGGSEDSIAFQSDDTIRVYMSPVAGNGTVTTAVLRDPSAWYHVVIAVDTTQATAANRTIIYVNNVNVTSSSSNYITQNSDTKFNGVFSHFLGRYANQTMPTGNFNGYMTEINFVDGQALTPSDFGLTDPQTGAWIPKKYTGTYGTNGFYVNFSDNSSTGTLGYDYSGNSNNWTSNNFSVTAGAGNDSLTDVPTTWIAYNTSGDTGGIWRGNYCTMNPLVLGSSGISLVNGNLDISRSNTTFRTVFGTVSIPTSGKWYWEVTAGEADNLIGIADATASVNKIVDTYASNGILSYSYYGNGGDKYLGPSNTTAAYGNSYTNGDVIGVALDLDNGKIWFAKNNTWQASGSPTGGTNAAYTGLTSQYVPLVTTYATGTTTTVNFGQRPFAYAPPAGFLSLCTTNLPTPTIGATSTTQAGKYFNTVLYTGTGSSLGVTGVGFQPDFVWIKERSEARSHALFDVLRGATIRLYSDSTVGDQTETTTLTAFNTDGFTVSTSVAVNNSAQTYASWNWKANGAGVSNTAGSISSTVSANTTAGFSIVTYTGTGANATVGHGLGVAPSMIITKNRSTTSQWAVYHSRLTSANYALLLDLTNAEDFSSAYWNSTAPTSTLFSVGGAASTNGSGNNMVAYCFTPVAGYSAFGSFTGNGSADGPFIYLGFRPKYWFWKRTDSTSDWDIQGYDTSYNPALPLIFLNKSDAEYTGSPSYPIDLLSNGVKIRSVNQNANGGTYIYAAFAEFPFKFSNAR